MAENRRPRYANLYQGAVKKVSLLLGAPDGAPGPLGVTEPRTVKNDDAILL
jgi:hypothetical protein